MTGASPPPGAVILAVPDTTGAIRPRSSSPASGCTFSGCAGRGPGLVPSAKLGTAFARGTVAVARGRWGAVLLVGIALRVALDPQVFLYDPAGLHVAALGWDLS